MSGASEAAAALQAVVRRASADIGQAGRDYTLAAKDAQAGTDVVDVMGGMVAVIAAAERLGEAARDAARDARTALATQMMETGAHQIHSAGLIAYLSRKPAFVSVDQPDLVPKEYLTTPEPKWDSKRIKAAIDAGDVVPGCSLVKPNEMSLGIRGAKQS